MSRKIDLNQLLNPVETKDLESFYQLVMKDEPALESTGGEPLYMQAARERAREMGISSDQLLSQYSEALKSSTYPTPQCLTPEEVEPCTKGALSEDRLKHVSGCEPCRELLSGAEPTSDRFEDLMKELHRKIELAKNTSPTESNTKSMVAGGSIRNRSVR